MIGVLHIARTGKIRHSEPLWQLQQEVIEHVGRVWRQPDEGIWEVRGPRRHFTHSKLMAWVALDRGVKAIEDFSHEGPARRWRTLRRQIHREICQKGFNPHVGAFTQYFGGKSLDASLLMMPLLGFLPITDPRVRSTIEAIERRLTHRGFVMRYLPTGKNVDGLPAGEGAFLACSFWLVNNLVSLGRRKDAEALFERLLAVRNDVGLLAEEYDPIARRQLTLREISLTLGVSMTAVKGRLHKSRRQLADYFSTIREPWFTETPSSIARESSLERKAI